MTDLKPGSRWLLPVTIYDVVGFGERPPHHVEVTTDNDDYISIFNPDLDTLIPADRITELEAEVARQREALAAWMIKNSYATGHGDTLDDLLSELDWQHAKRNTTNAHD